jgi:putative phage-type endonuclease
MTDEASIIQGSDQWRAIRCGKLTASRMADATAKTKTGWGASRANLMAELIAERLTGVPAQGFQNSAMQWGTDTEPQARAAYEFMRNYDVVEVGFVTHPLLPMSGASPDGLVGDLGLIEIKCPNTSTHIDTLLGGAVPGKYLTQIQWQLACTGRAWCDFVSFDPRMPENMQLFVKRVTRDGERIAELTEMAEQFLQELDAKLNQLREAYERAA